MTDTVYVTSGPPDGGSPVTPSLAEAIGAVQIFARLAQAASDATRADAADVAQAAAEASAALPLIANALDTIEAARLVVVSGVTAVEADRVVVAADRVMVSEDRGLAAQAKTDAITAASQAAQQAVRFSASSGSSHTVGLGAKTFTTQADKAFAPGMALRVTSDADPSGTFMAGVVTGYAGTALTIAIEASGGTGAHADWSIRLSGGTGARGPAGTGTVNHAGTPATGEFAVFGANGDVITGGGQPGNAATRNVGTSAGSVAAGNDSRIVGAAQKAANLTDLTDKAAALGTLGGAPLASPALTGIPTAPTATNATSTAQIATTAFVHALIDALVGMAPAELDTLKEIADRLHSGEDTDAALASAIAGKQASHANLTALSDLAGAAGKLAAFTGPGAMALLTLGGGANNVLQLDGSKRIPAGVDGSLLVNVAGGAASLYEASVSANRTVTATDKGKLLKITNAPTLTADSAADLGAGWNAYLWNVGSGSPTWTAASGTVDGLSSYPIYPGEMRWVYSTGAAIVSVVLCPLLMTATSSGTFIKPPGYQAFDVEGLGAGAGGGSGRRGAAGSNRYGGQGGGGGGYLRKRLVSGALAASVAMTIGAGGSGGSPATANDSNGTDGLNGGDTSFGPHLVAFRGRAGQGGATGAVATGNGGGVLTTQGAPVAPSGLGPGTFGSGNHSPGNLSGPSVWGGGSGAGAGFGDAGADSVEGGPGGGAGSFIGSDNSESVATTGGGLPVAGSSGATGHGAATGGAIGASGAAGAAAMAAVAGTAGGGGRAGSLAASGTAGGSGGNGGPGAGGGGGGASTNGSNSGAGGNGGDGRLRIAGVL